MTSPLLEYVAPSGEVEPVFLLGFSEGKAILAWTSDRTIGWEWVERLVEKDGPWRLARTRDSVVAFEPTDC